MAVRSSVFIRAAAAIALTVDAACAGFVSVRALVAVAAAAAVSAAWLPLRRLAATTIPATAFTLAAIVIFSIGSDIVDRRTAYRPFELLQEYDAGCKCRHFKANAALEKFAMPYGDLVPLGRFRRQPLDVAPRVVTYRTDRLGLRNDSGYSGQRLILVGDSFAAGDDNDQVDTPAAQLTGAGAPAYDVAFSGDPADYAQLLGYFSRHEHPEGAETAVLLFEGNDFGHPADPDPASLGSRIRSVRAPLTRTAYYRLTFSIWTRLTYDLSPAAADPASGVTVRTLGTHRVGFLNAYVDQTRAADDDVAADASALAHVLAQFNRRTTRVFLVPTKYRVYYPLFEAGGPPLPERAWRITQAACAAAGIACEDLSTVLIAAARDALASDDALVYWPDDTHWNRRGIAAGVAAIRRSMSQAGLSR